MPPKSPESIRQGGVHGRLSPVEVSNRKLQTPTTTIGRTPSPHALAASRMVYGIVNPIGTVACAMEGVPLPCTVLVVPLQGCEYQGSPAGSALCPIMSLHIDPNPECMYWTGVSPARLLCICCLNLLLKQNQCFAKNISFAFRFRSVSILFG